MYRIFWWKRARLLAHEEQFVAQATALHGKLGGLPTHAHQRRRWDPLGGAPLRANHPRVLSFVSITSPIDAITWT